MMRPMTWQVRMVPRLDLGGTVRRLLGPDTTTWTCKSCFSIFCIVGSIFVVVRFFSQFIVIVWIMVRHMTLYSQRYIIQCAASPTSPVEAKIELWFLQQSNGEIYHLARRDKKSCEWIWGHVL